MINPINISVILAELNVFDRTQAAIIAIQHDLDKDWSLKPNLLAPLNPFAPKHRRASSLSNGRKRTVNRHSPGHTRYLSSVAGPQDAPPRPHCIKSRLK